MKFTWKNHPDAKLIAEELREHPHQFEDSVILVYLGWLAKDKSYSGECMIQETRRFKDGRKVQIFPFQKAVISQDVYDDADLEPVVLFEIAWDELESLAGYHALMVTSNSVYSGGWDDEFESPQPILSVPFLH